MFRPYEEDWVQPFTCFATKGAAKDEMLYELLAKAVCVLYNHLAIVKNFFAREIANYDFYSKLYKQERFNGLRLAHRLTESHIYPTNFQRMNVRKAAQVLSRTIAMAIRHYREKDETKWSEGTERLTKLMNDVFDVLNGRCSSQGITKDNWEAKKKVLNAMLTVLNRTEDVHMRHDPDLPAQMFCSETTCWN
ncbi:Uncharacterized protein APZ42_034026 [Daphnia magna]|uniref:Transposable element P transposase-like GTP-binding insertion domain-containing protein n=1 Tax=Daphnia magna TaxID=35525 RepID=A0A164KIJ9_9CRUS|nr:Uncharacterized protein APZ42_034026 [Daphnia magna]